MTNYHFFFLVYKQSRIDAKLLLNLIVNFVEGESVIKSYFNENVSKFLKRFSIFLFF